MVVVDVGAAVVVVVVVLSGAAVVVVVVTRWVVDDGSVVGGSVVVGSVLVGAALDDVRDSTRLQQRAQEFSVDKAAHRYLELIRTLTST